jgi:hypothetical protein
VRNVFYRMSAGIAGSSPIRGMAVVSVFFVPSKQFCQLSVNKITTPGKRLLLLWSGEPYKKKVFK